MLLAAYLRDLTKIWSHVNRPWRRILFLALGLLLATAVSVRMFRHTISEASGRWRLPAIDVKSSSSLKSPQEIFHLDDDGTTLQHHPIDDLIQDAEILHEQVLNKQTNGVAQAAQAYRERRGRHPPPRFEQWVEFAQSRGCLMVEDFFDRIYHDLDPFWAIPAHQFRADAAAWPNYIKIRNGVPSRSEEEQLWMPSYFDLVQKIAKFLPDIDIPINHMDEPRILVPWNGINDRMSQVQAARALHNLVIAPEHDEFTDQSDEPATEGTLELVTEGSYWNFARETCHPGTEAATLDIDTDFSTPPIFPNTHPYGTHHGFVQNWTTSQSVCNHPHLRNMHGTFVEPISISTTALLVPVFSGSKLLTNNDILLPAAMYWADEERFAASTHHIEWHEKRDEVFWRGTASGGRNKLENWTRFHRHRLVSLLNGTQIAMTLNASHTGADPNNDAQNLPRNFPLPNQTLYPLISTKLHLLADWVRSFADVAFNWLECFPSTEEFGCSYTGQWYSQGEQVQLHQMFLNKFLPDVDGNSFSGRFRAFMLSNSLPIKATIYTEWHDSRLIPWKHFVPMDNTFTDTLSILEYFFKHDERAERIARDGRLWAEQVLRKEDMLVYVYRLLLEYARIGDPNREKLGYGGDLK